MKQYKIILLDVDGTLLDFDKAEEQGIGFLLRTYGVPETEENKEAYHKLNQSYWRRMERGELTRDQVLCLRFEEFFGGFGLSVDGKETDQVPFDTYASVEPVYTEFKGWNADLTGCRSESALPSEFKEYISFMENYLGVPIKIISLGPDRDATIMR